MESIRLSTTLSASPREVYDAWISSKGHTAMTGSPATSDARVGGAYTACDDYIKGTHLALDKGVRILQAWRTTEFPEAAQDSRLEIRLAATKLGTKLTLLQSGIPDGQSEMYFDGWQEIYFMPMKKYFDGKVSAPGSKKPAEKAKPPSKKRTDKKISKPAPVKKKVTPAKKKTAPVVERAARKKTSGRSATKPSAKKKKKR